MNVKVTMCSLAFKLTDRSLNKLCGRPPQYAPVSCKFIFDLLTLKVMSESRVTWPTSAPILVFSIYTMKNNEVIAENPFQNSGVTRRL